MTEQAVNLLALTVWSVICIIVGYVWHFVNEKEKQSK